MSSISERVDCVCAWATCTCTVDAAAEMHTRELGSSGPYTMLFCLDDRDCDFVYWEILKCCLTRVRNLGISGACLTLGGSWRHVE